MSPRDEAPRELPIARGRFAGKVLHVSAIGVVYVTGRVVNDKGEVERVMIPRASFDAEIGPGDDERAARKRIHAREPDLLGVVLR